MRLPIYSVVNIIYIIIIVNTHVLVTPVFGLPSIPEPHQNNCEAIANAIQEEKGGYIILLARLQENGAYDLSWRAGHYINVLTFHSRKYYIDFPNQYIFDSEKEMLRTYKKNGLLYEIVPLNEIRNINIHFT